MKHTIKQELQGVLLFVAAIWGVYLADFVVPGDFTLWGLVPRTAWGLVGIPLTPFLHASFGHLISNTLPLLVLLMLMAGSRARTWPTVAEMILLGGGLLWLFGRGERHVGASVLVYSLIAFLIVAGFREKRLIPLLIALVVGFFYGGTLISGVLPSIGSNISWEGHLFGAIAGGILGYVAVGREEPASEVETVPSNPPPSRIA